MRKFLFLYLAVAIHFFVAGLLWSIRVPNLGSYYCNVRVPESLSVEVVQNKPKKKGLQQKKQESQANENGDSEIPAHAKTKGDFEKFLGKEKGKWKDLIRTLEKTKGIRDKYRETFEDIVKNSGVSKSYIYRKRRYEDIIVKDVFPTLRNIEKPFEKIIQEAPQDLETYNRRNEIIEDYRQWSRGENLENKFRMRLKSNEKKQGKSPLKFPPKQREKYFDSILKKSKEEQLHEFLKKYMGYDPNKGDLPIAVRELYYKNLQRLAYRFSTDPTYLMLDYFDENLNKEDFLKNALYQVSQLKGTKAGTELLFAIENIYEIQQRAVKLMLDFRREYKSLPEKKKKELRIETLRRVEEKYRPILESKKLNDYKKLYDIYSKRRVEIMDYIVKTSPNCYRCSDALFEKARILWMRGVDLNDAKAMQRAVHIWKNLSVEKKPGEDFLNRETLIELKPLLANFSPNDIMLRLQINRILNLRLQKYLEEKGKREKRLLYPE